MRPSLRPILSRIWSSCLQHPKVKAIGEIGLDYHWGTPKEIQTPAFIRQLEIAADEKCPLLFTHAMPGTTRCRYCAPHWAGHGLPCVMHCFTGNVEQAQECLDLGFYLAFGGVTTFPKAIEIRRGGASLRLRIACCSKRIAPYLAPRSLSRQTQRTGVS